jgi:hypothetical protein
MSLAAQTAKTASNWNLALTLNWFIGQLEEAQAAGRQGIPLGTALDMINDCLSDLERKRIALANEPRVKLELAHHPKLAEVLS